MTDKKSARMRIDMALIVKIRKRLDNFELNTDIQTDDDILALDRKSTRLNSSHPLSSRMPSSA